MSSIDLLDALGDLLGLLDARADGRLVDDAELRLVGLGEELGADLLAQEQRRDEERQDARAR